MKVIINDCFGGYSLNESLRERLGLDYFEQSDDENRTRVDIIAEVERSDYEDAPHSALVVCDIPAEATDYIITEYDGLEDLYYVLDGKIHRYGSEA